MRIRRFLSCLAAFGTQRPKVRILSARLVLGSFPGASCAVTAGVLPCATDSSERSRPVASNLLWRTALLQGSSHQSLSTGHVDSVFALCGRISAIRRKVLDMGEEGTIIGTSATIGNFRPLGGIRSRFTSSPMLAVRLG